MPITCSSSNSRGAISFMRICGVHHQVVLQTRLPQPHGFKQLLSHVSVMSLPECAKSFYAFFSGKSSGNICDMNVVIMLQSGENLPGIYAQAWVSRESLNVRRQTLKKRCMDMRCQTMRTSTT